jgi:hypothetical protein
MMKDKVRLINPFRAFIALALFMSVQGINGEEIALAVTDLILVNFAEDAPITCSIFSVAIT